MLKCMGNSPWIAGHEVESRRRGSGEEPNGIQQAFIGGIDTSDVLWVFGHFHH